MKELIEQYLTKQNSHRWLLFENNYQVVTVDYINNRNNERNL
jgi:hypothetical protein